MNKLLQSLKDGSLSARLYKKYITGKRLFYLADDNVRVGQINYEIYHHLKKKYGYVLDKELPVQPRAHGDKIWTCWFQGMENAPKVCQSGYERFCQIYGRDKVVVITAENYKDYLDLPDYIIDKWQKGIISQTHFSDIARYFLLEKYGGTWIDATILILDDKLPNYFNDSELFLFADHLTGIYPNIQSSYITAYSHSRLIKAVCELIKEYWRKENYTLDYNMYHYFFQMAEERYPEEWEKVYRYPNHATHVLRKYLLQPFDQQLFEQIRDMCPVQKLTHKRRIEGDISGTFYDILIEHTEDFFRDKKK